MKLCKNCNTDISDLHHNKRFCDTNCLKEYKQKQNVSESHQKYTDPESYVECKICSYRAPDLTSHIERTHNMKCIDYKSEHNVTHISSDNFRNSISDRTTGKNNPGYQHNGRFSALSKNFVKYKGLSDNEINENKKCVSKKISKSNKENGNNHRTIAYWLNEANGNKEEAKRLLSKHQVWFSLEMCIQKHGEEKGTEIWKDRQKRWLSNFKRLNYSKISQQLFWSIVNTGRFDLNDIMFAQLNKNKEKDETGKNYEYLLKLDESFCKPDFVLFSTKSIIEFDGDYWHGEKRGNKARDRIRDKKIQAVGYKIFHVAERDYKTNPVRVINNCIEFLETR